MSPTLSHPLKLLDELSQIPSLTSEIFPLAHIFHNPQFLPGMDIKSFQLWLDKGMYRIGHYLSVAGPLILKHCINKLELPISERFRFQQISHFLSSIWKNKSAPPECTYYEHWCRQAKEQKGVISIIYTALSKPSSKFPYMEAWESDLQVTWDLEDWHQAISRAFKGKTNVSLVEANLKVITRWYLVPTRLAILFPSASPLCFSECPTLGYMIHVWWECPKITGFWSIMFSLIRKVSGHSVPKFAQEALLNFPIP